MSKDNPRELYEMFALTAPVNPPTGAPCPPSSQKISTWAVEAWDQVPEELCAKDCTACWYKTNNELDGDSDTYLVPYSDE